MVLISPRSWSPGASEAYPVATADADIAAAQSETARLHSIIQQVQQFEQRWAHCNSASPDREP
jgi:hypothetical protein